MLPDYTIQVNIYIIRNKRKKDVYQNIIEPINASWIESNI